ncbi:MAG TPA: isochorismatase family protein [Myxococcales bacterium]|nr:isochorismatase family protein [Myxococcales bacterium]
MPSELPDPRTLALDRSDALLLLVDVQEKLARAMPEEGMARVTKNAGILLKAARRLGLPVVASEQYKKGLGDTLSELRELLALAPVEKMEFSCGASQPIAREILRTGRKQVIVLGMEAHVCVFQTVRDLLRGGFAVFVPEDAIVSRTEENRAIGLHLCEKAGATLTSTETVLFDLLGVAGTPEFKELAPLIR